MLRQPTREMASAMAVEVYRLDVSSLKLYWIMKFSACSLIILPIYGMARAVVPTRSTLSSLCPWMVGVKASNLSVSAEMSVSIGNTFVLDFPVATFTLPQQR